MKKNIYSELIIHVLKILDRRQKKSALILLLFMIIGMMFEIFLLKNLLFLLNFISKPVEEVPETIFFLKKIFSFEDASIVVLFLFIITFFIKILITILLKLKESKFIFSLKAQLSEKLFKGYLKLPFIYHQRTNTAKMFKNITVEVDQFSILVFSLSTFVLEAIIFLGISSYLIFFNPFTSAICIFTFIMFGYFFNLFNKSKLREMSLDRIKHQEARIKSIMEAIAGIREIKLFAKESTVLQDFNVHNYAISNISVSSSIRNALTKPAFEIFMLLFLSIFLFYFISQNILSASIIPVFGVYLAAAYRLVPSISQLVHSIQIMQFNLKCAKNLSDEINKFKIEESKKTQENCLITFNKDILIKSLSFSYQPEEENSKNLILENIDFKINKGDLVGIQGKSGSGKSTLLDLILGVLQLKEGSIEVDNKTINKNNFKSWHKLIGYVPQKITIIEESIKNNILFGTN